MWGRVLLPILCWSRGATGPEKHLEEALQLTRALSEGLQALGEAEARPLLRCVLAFQMEATSSCSSFQKLEQMVTQLAVGKEALLAQEVDTLLSGLALQGEVLSPEDLQSVSMFLEESSLGRQHWQQNLPLLLQRLASTLHWVLQGQPTPGSTWGYLVIKACLQVFQVLPKDVAPLVWSTSGKSETLQSLLGLLLEVAWGKALNKDTRLLAGTALSMLVNTAPQPQHGASAVLTLFQLPSQGTGELKFGELVVEVPPVLEPDGLEKLVLTRGVLTCCKMDILSCQLEGLPNKACLLLDVVFPAVCALSREQKDCYYYCFQACALWLQRLREGLAALWHLMGTHVLAQDSELLQELTQLLWNNAETPVEGVSEFIHSSFQLLLEIYHLECQHFQDQERPLYQQMLQRVVSMPWQIKARYVPLCAIVPYMGSQQLSIASLSPGSNYQRKKTALLLLAAVLETCTDTWSPDRKKGQPPRTMATLLSYARQRGCWDFFSQPNLLALMSCLQDSTNEIRDLASELLVRYFPTTFPEPIAQDLFQLAQDTLGSPRVQEAEAGAVLLKTILQKSDSGTMKSLSLEAEAALTLPSRGLCFAQHLLRVLQAQYKVARQDLLRAAATAPMHGAIAALRRCLLQVPEVAVSMQVAELVQSWQELLTCLVTTVRDITSLLLGALQSQQGPGADEQAAAPSFAEMGNAIGSLIMLGKGQGQEEEEGDSVLLSEEHSLILTCCWVSVKEIGLLLGGLAELLLSPALPAEVGPLLPLPTLQMATRVFQEILLRCRHWGAVEGCSMGFTKFCAALLNHPDPELQAIPRAVLEQGLEALGGPRSSSITRRAAGFPMLFLCIVSGEAPAQARPLLTRCIQTLLSLAAMALPQDWDQTLDLPQVCALHVLQTLVRGAGLGGAVLCHATPMMALALRGLGSPCWAMRNAAIQLFSALTSRLLGQPWSHRDGCPSEGLSLHAFLGQHPELGAVLLGELKVATAPTSGGPRLHPALHAILTLLAQLQPGADIAGSPSAPFLEPLLGLAESPIYAVRAMAAKALVPVVAPPQRCRLLLQLARQLPAAPGQIRSHNAVHGHLLQMQALLGCATGTGGLSAEALHPVALQLEARGWLLTPAQRCPLVRAAFLQLLALLPTSFSPGFAQYIHGTISAELGSLLQGGKSGCAEPQVGSAILHQTMAHFMCSEAARLADSERVAAVCSLLQQPNPDIQLAILSWVIAGEGGPCKEVENALGLTLLESLQSVLQERRDKEFLRLYLEALLHLYRDPSSWSQEASNKLQGSSRSCLEMLLHMVEAECPGPDLLFQALCAASLLLAHQCGDEDTALVERWCAALEECSRSACSELLRLAAARSLQLAGPSVLQPSLCAARPSLVPVALRLINVAIHLLQDEEPEVRHEASGFASLLRQSPGELLQDGCIFVQDNVGLQSLLELLLGEFGEHPETFNSLLQHIPVLDVRSVVEELEANKAVSLYKEDEPNVFAEPAVLAQQLLPVLVQLLEKAPTGSPVHASALQWLEATGPGVLRDLQYCRHCWSQGPAARWGMKALGCAKLHTALAVLLVRAQLVAQVLRVLGEGATAMPGLGCGSQELEQELELVQGLLVQHGLAPVPRQDNAPGELGPLSGTDNSRHAAV
ncbi:hypothetical protein EK904_006247 [Melospiza melodia maxima]|nr:hypothetical protein EK904_006247 [Melospiza melodia maxima]